MTVACMRFALVTTMTGSYPAWLFLSGDSTHILHTYIGTYLSTTGVFITRGLGSELVIGQTCAGETLWVRFDVATTSPAS